jgi:hypothetical protein
MEEYLDQLWNISFDALRDVQLAFNRNCTLIRTEADLQSMLLCAIRERRSPSISFEAHSEITWYEADEHRSFRRDISIFDPLNIETNDVNRITLSKGFRHRGPMLGIELKYIRSNDTLAIIHRKTWEDLERLIRYSHRFYASNREIGYPKKFVIIIGCSPDTDVQEVKQIFIANIGRFMNEVEQRGLPWFNMIQTIIQPILFSVDESILLWD